MGNKQSSSIEQTMKLVNDTALNLMNSNKTSSNTKNINTNTFSLDIRGNVGPNCPINIVNKIKSTQNVTFNSMVQNTTQLQSLMQQTIQNVAKNTNSSEQGFLATSFSSQESRTKLSTDIINKLDLKLVNETLNEINNIIENANNGTLIIWKDCNAPITATQDIVSEQIAQVITNSISDAAMSLSTVTDAVNKAEQENKSKQSGISEFINSLGNLFGLGMFATYGIPISSSCCLCICCILCIMLMSMSGKKTQV